MRLFTRLLLVLSLALIAMATTLERLSLDEMILKSTAIVRGRVTDSSCVQRGNIIYTVYRLKVSERIKGGSTAATADVYLPGGTLGGFRQSFAGTPAMDQGAEYVVFLWVSPKGVSQVIGLGQGVFDVKPGTNGDTILSRGPLEADVVDTTGRRVNDQGLKLTLQRLRDAAAHAGVTGKAEAVR